MDTLTIFDRLYGPIEFDQKDLKLFQTPELTRLRQVSLTAIPYWLLPTGTCATKFEHSLGCAHLARQLLEHTQFGDQAINIYLAALLHDLGTPPFSHASEYFQEKIFKQNHEAYSIEMLQGKSLNQLIKSLGGNVETIHQLITGNCKPLSDLINGSIDIDNLDNSLRFGVSMGLLLGISYSPEELATSFRYQHRKFTLQLNDVKSLQAWEMCRQRVYKFVYSPANLAPGMMLYRAMDYAYHAGELTKTYFHLTDEQAFHYLETSCNQITRNLINQVKHWHFYQQAFATETHSPSPRFRQLTVDSDFRWQVSNQLADHLQTNPENVSVYIRVNKAHKDIHLPIVDDQGNPVKFQQLSKPSWIMQVYVHPSLTPRSMEIREFIEEITDSNIS